MFCHNIGHTHNINIVRPRYGDLLLKTDMLSVECHVEVCLITWWGASRNSPFWSYLVTLDMAAISLAMAVFNEKSCCVCGERCLKLAYRSVLKQGCSMTLYYLRRERRYSALAQCCGFVGTCVKYMGSAFKQCFPPCSSTQRRAWTTQKQP